MSKQNKRRPCPAVGHDITPAECGEGRGSRYACPADCRFNPFGSLNYDMFLEVEGEVDAAAMRWLDQDARDRSELSWAMDRARQAKTATTLHALIVWRLFYLTDAEGRTCAQRYEQAGFPSLKNDGRVLMRGKMGIRVALLEIHRVLDHEQVEVVDLFEAEPKPFLVRDRGLASSAARFACGLTWVYAAPHFSRLSGTALLLPDIGLWTPREMTLEIVRHLGGPTEGDALRRWLCEHFTRFEEALTAAGVEQRRRMLASIDAKFGKAVYELQRPFAECSDRIDQHDNVDEDTLTEGERREGFAEARAWFATEEDRGLAMQAGPDVRPLLGRVLLGQSHWRLEAMGAEKMASLRQRFEQHMGSTVRFAGERLDDLAQSLAEKEPRVDASLVPPSLTATPNQIRIFTSRVPTSIAPKSIADRVSDTVAAQERRFLDDAVPALDGRPPREAAKDPALRPKLVHLMKQRVRACDEHNLKTGENRDVNWMLRELGLDEILFDPPPPGRFPRTGRPRDDEDWDADEEDDPEEENVALDMDPTLPPAPPVPEQPLTREELDRRLRETVEGCNAMEDALQTAEEEGCTLFDDVLVVTEGLVDEDHIVLLTPLLLEAWRVFVPVGMRGFNLTRTDLRDAITRDAQAMLAASRSGNKNAIANYLDATPQPLLAGILLEQLLHVTKLLPRKQAPSPEQEAVLGCVLRAVIEQLHRAHSE